MTDDLAEARRWALHLVLGQVADALGPVVDVGEEVPGTAPGWRLLLVVEGQGRVFLKAGDGGPADEAVGAEVALLEAVRHRHMPYVLAGDPLGQVPWMVQRDLSAASWPPPWPRRMGPVWAALGRLARATPPPWLPRPDDLDPWAALAETATGTEAWRPHVDRLGEAAARVSLAGDALVHGDLGGGNLCRHEGSILVMDWSDAMVANPAIDLLSVAVDAAHHDGVRTDPPVEDLPAWMAKTAGLLLTASQRPPWPGAGGAEVRRSQADLARTAVAWALDLTA